MTNILVNNVFVFTKGIFSYKTEMGCHFNTRVLYKLHHYSIFNYLLCVLYKYHSVCIKLGSK